MIPKWSLYIQLHSTSEYQDAKNKKQGSVVSSWIAYEFPWGICKAVVEYGILDCVAIFEGKKVEMEKKMGQLS